MIKNCSEEIASNSLSVLSEEEQFIEPFQRKFPELHFRHGEVLENEDSPRMAMKEEGYTGVYLSLPYITGIIKTTHLAQLFFLWVLYVCI